MWLAVALLDWRPFFVTLVSLVIKVYFGVSQIEIKERADNSFIAKHHSTRYWETGASLIDINTSACTHARTCACARMFAQTHTHTPCTLSQTHTHTHTCTHTHTLANTHTHMHTHTHTCVLSSTMPKFQPFWQRARIFCSLRSQTHSKQPMCEDSAIDTHTHTHTHTHMWLRARKAAITRNGQTLLLFELFESLDKCASVHGCVPHCSQEVKEMHKLN